MVPVFLSTLQAQIVRNIHFLHLKMSKISFHGVLPMKAAKVILVYKTQTLIKFQKVQQIILKCRCRENNKILL